MKPIRIYLLILIFSLLTSACASEAYFIPPSAPPAVPPEFAAVYQASLLDLHVDGASDQVINVSDLVEEISDTNDENPATEVVEENQTTEPSPPVAVTSTPEVTLVSSAPYLYYTQAARGGSPFWRGSIRYPITRSHSRDGIPHTRTIAGYPPPAG